MKPLAACKAGAVFQFGFTRSREELEDKPLFVESSRIAHEF
jgi:hypothetical protein